MQKNQVFKFEIISPLQGQRLDKALTVLASAEIPAFSRARLQALLANGHVTCSGKPVTNASHKAKEGEIYTLHLPPLESAKPEAEQMDLKIAFEDKDVLVVDKPPGLVVHPAPGNRRHTLVNALIAHCGKSLSGIGGVARPGIVHRLDKDTSGLIIIAKNDVAHQSLSSQFADRTLSRTYQALVWGRPTPTMGRIDAPLGRHTRDRKKMSVTTKGKMALTHYKVLEVFKDVTLLECKLETGRTHQIRVHLAHIKHPVVGDPVYGQRGGAKKLEAFPRQALHAAELQFRHPRSEKIIRLTSKLPKDMATLVRALRKKAI